MNKKPKVKIVKGGNKGGRRTEAKFGVEPNSIAAQLAFMRPEIRRLYDRNMKRHSDDASSMERWAANDFESGYEVNGER